jgi:hypothetical protein
MGRPTSAFDEGSEAVARSLLTDELASLGLVDVTDGTG